MFLMLLSFLVKNGFFKRAGSQINLTPFKEIQVDVVDDCIILCRAQSSCKAVLLPQTVGSPTMLCQLFTEFDLFSDVSISTVWDMFEKST